MGEFTNEHRYRYYGLRVGDTVEDHFNKVKIGEVVSYVSGDNNRVYVHFEGETEARPVVAEWMNIIKKVEDK